MQNAMYCWGHCNKVSRSIVFLVPVNVVDMLVFEALSSDPFL